MRDDTRNHSNFIIITKSDANSYPNTAIINITGGSNDCYISISVRNFNPTLYIKGIQIYSTRECISILNGTNCTFVFDNTFNYVESAYGYPAVFIDRNSCLNIQGGKFSARCNGENVGIGSNISNSNNYLFVDHNILRVFGGKGTKIGGAAISVSHLEILSSNPFLFGGSCNDTVCIGGDGIGGNSLIGGDVENIKFVKISNSKFVSYGGDSNHAGGAGIGGGSSFNGNGGIIEEIIIKNSILYCFGGKGTTKYGGVGIGTGSSFNQNGGSEGIIKINNSEIEATGGIGKISGGVGIGSGFGMIGKGGDAPDIYINDSTIISKGGDSETLGGAAIGGGNSLSNIGGKIGTISIIGSNITAKGGVANLSYSGSGIARGNTLKSNDDPLSGELYIERSNVVSYGGDNNISMTSGSGILANKITFISGDIDGRSRDAKRAVSYNEIVSTSILVTLSFGSKSSNFSNITFQGENFNKEIKNTDLIPSISFFVPKSGSYSLKGRMMAINKTVNLLSNGEAVFKVSKHEIFGNIDVLLCKLRFAIDPIRGSLEFTEASQYYGETIGFPQVHSTNFTFKHWIDTNNNIIQKSSTVAGDMTFICVFEEDPTPDQSPTSSPHPTSSDSPLSTPSRSISPSRSPARTNFVPTATVSAKSSNLIIFAVVFGMVIVIGVLGFVLFIYLKAKKRGKTNQVMIDDDLDEIDIREKPLTEESSFY